jgi:hypothetical protein
MISFLSILLLCGPMASAQDLKTFRAYEPRVSPRGTQDLFLMVDQDIDLDPGLGRLLHIRVSEGLHPNRISCDRDLALDGDRILKTCNGLSIRFDEPIRLRDDLLVDGTLLGTSARSAGTRVEFELKYTQDGVHEGGRDD